MAQSEDKPLIDYSTYFLDNNPNEENTFPQDGLNYVSNVSVDFKNLEDGKKFYKRQCRKIHKREKKGRQVIENGVVNIEAKYAQGQLLCARGWVRREPKAAKLYGDKNGDAPICGEDNEELNLIKKCDVPMFTADGYTLQPFSVDLGEIYDGPERPVFELSRSNMEQLNKFQLIVQLVFVDERTSTKFVSPVFTCCTKPKKRKPEEAPGYLYEPPNQRARHDSGESSIPADSPCFSTDSGLENSHGHYVRHSHILVDTLDAKTANIKELVYDTMSSTKADIAYHLKLKNPLRHNELEEGDIVGFYEHEDSSETYIQKLQSSNVEKAVHAGVISRSYWMEGHKPQKPGETDTVCVIGIVHVKVIGSIENGERIYASRDRPGKAIPQSQVPVGTFLRKKHVLLGMALEGKKSAKTSDEMHLVKCFVCIVLDVSRQELLEEIEHLYKVNEIRTEVQIKLHSKKTWRRLKCCFTISVILIGLIIFLLYQWLAPGSMFRYWLCRRGSIRPTSNLYLKFEDVNKRLLDVHGIQFTMAKLQDKVGVKFDENTLLPNDTARYYLNIDRCAYYWVDGATGNNIGGHKYVGGSRILSVFRNCSSVYECREQEVESWEIMRRQRNVTCSL